MMAPRRPTALRKQRGFTFLELMITLVVAAILIFATVPSFVRMITRIRVEGTGNELSADLQYARTEAVRRRATVTLLTHATGYAITTPASGSGTVQLKGVQFASGVRVVEEAVGVTYDAMRAMANGGTLTISDATDAAQLRVNVNVMGRVEMCSPGRTISNYPSC